MRPFVVGVALLLGLVVMVNGAFAWAAARARRLDLLWRDMRAHGVRIVAYLPPYHPLVWDGVRRNDGAMAGLARTRAALADLAGPRAGVHDLSDPALLPCVEP